MRTLNGVDWADRAFSVASNAKSGRKAVGGSKGLNTSFGDEIQIQTVHCENTTLLIYVPHFAIN